MLTHLRSSLLLLGLTVLLCSVLYPLALLGVARGLFPHPAEGSLIVKKGADGTDRVVGSQLIGQPFAAEEYFWPRPSAAGDGYNATASGGSNYGASNPKLRDRVARQLGPIVKYRQDGPRKNDSVQKDIEKWFGEKPDRAATWAAGNPTLAADWAKSAGVGTSAEEIAAYFAEYTKAHPGTWPDVAEEKAADGSVAKKIVPIQTGPAISAVFFDSWLREHAGPDLLEPVPADMVTASGSGLDPHITLRNALSVYQLDRVAARRNVTREQVRALLEAHSFTPLSGLVGEPLVNVLEVNLELDEKFPVPK